MFTAQDIQTILKNHFNSNEFQVLKYDVSDSSLMVKLLKENAEHETCNSDLTSTYLVVFEDLLQQGFVSTEKFDLDHIRLVLEVIAKRRGETDFQSQNLETLSKSLDNLMQAFPNEVCVPEDFQERLMAIIRRKIKDTIVCNGFVTSEHVLFKYNNGRPIECKLIDLNRQTNEHPAYNVLQFIYLVTDQKFRQHHLHDLLDFYFELDPAQSSKEDFEVTTHCFLPLIKLRTARYAQIAYQKVKTAENYMHLTKSFEELIDAVINPDLTLEDCFQIIKAKIGSANYDLLSYELIPIGKVSGFFGDHKKLKIEIKTDKVTTLNFFVKFTPKGAAQKSIADDFGSFYKENFFYRDFVAKATKVKSPITDCTVPCYLARLNDVLVFEDFDIRNYGILNHREPLAYPVVEVIIKQLAKLHASSIILEDKHSEQTQTKFRLNEQYEKGLKESFFTKIPNHQGAKSTEISIVAIKDQIRLFPDPNSPFSDEIFRTKLTTAYELVFELVKPSEEFRNVICHGDLWINNILVHQSNGKPLDCRFIDFQIIRYCPPAQDLLGFLYLATNRAFRKEYMQEVIDLYYKEFASQLEKAGCDVEKIYSYEHFRRSIEYMLPQSVCQTAIYYHICITDPDLMKDYVSTEEKMKQIFLVDRRAFIAEMCERDSIYRERTKEAIEDLRDLCCKYF